MEFDDAEWQSVKASAMGNHVGTTAYIRREVQIPYLEDYHVLNVRVKYAGGVAVYFNGRLVARFNLAEGFDASTEAQTVHDSSFSKFHVILPMVGAVAGKNVMAFEVHRAPGQSAIVFDATGVFGVNDCSVAVDSCSSIDASPVTGCAKEGLREGRAAGAEDAFLRQSAQRGGLLPGVEGGEPGGLQVEPLRHPHEQRCLPVRHPHEQCC